MSSYSINDIATLTSVAQNAIDGDGGGSGPVLLHPSMLLPALPLFLNSPSAVDSAEPTVKQGFFPFLLFLRERPTAGWNCMPC